MALLLSSTLLPAYGSPPPRCLLLSSLCPSFQHAKHPGMLKYHWLHPTPAHPQAHSAFGYPLSSFHILSHYIMLTMWISFLSFFLFLIQTHIKVLRFCQQRSRDRVRPQWSEQADQMVQRCLAKKSHPIKTWKSRTSSKPYRQIAREGFSDIMPCLGRQLCYNMPFIDRMWCQT